MSFPVDDAARTPSTRSRAFEIEGFAILDSIIGPEQLALAEAGVEAVQLDAAGTRNLLNRFWCSDLAHALRADPDVAPYLPGDAVAVQCTLFAKSTERNWLVPWHQDLHIPVRERLDHPSLRGWSEKEDAIYVQPPIEVLQNLVAVRVHVDPCGSAHGPLRVVPGSHLSGRLPESSIPSMLATRGERLCCVERGGALILKPLLLHASSRATAPNQRRVLHFLFGPRRLPLGLRWGNAL
jgi:hypothetical protein